MDGSSNFYYSAALEDIADKTRSVLRKDLVDSLSIAVVSAKNVNCWSGFSDIKEAVKFKHERGLGDEWRVRDRRPSSVILPHEELGEAMLNIGSMIADHIRNLAGPVFAARKMSATARREITMFAHAILRESLISSDRDLGKWRPMRGKFLHNEFEVSHCWLEDKIGNILDFLPWNYEITPASYTCHSDSFVKNYIGVSVLMDGYGTEYGGYLRGEKSHPDALLSANEFRDRYLTLGDHIVSYLTRSRLPVVE